MRVKRLEIQGFKSFKDRTVVHFDQGITGIVGPNGCGKSNIVDAFFWVMGEQSYKHMRGTGAEDLIFNGSSKYNPLGMAEATLVMETDAFDTANAPAGASAKDLPGPTKPKEISVTRRVYRSGEGEYFINGQSARLKDIHELFMDTGVGAKGYSVIEQGQIGKIVNAKPEDRRLLVEEAAGIAKYKARKKESLRKMEATQANLARLTDVIQEIERGLGSLERQAQKARQYRRYKEELLDKELTWGRRKRLVLSQKLDALKKTRDAMEQELVGLRAELQIAENSVETDRIEQLTDSKRAEDLQTVIQGWADELATQKSGLELSRQRQGDLATQLSQLENEGTALDATLAQETERLTLQEAQASEAEMAHDQASEQASGRDEEVQRLRENAQTARRALEGKKRELMNGISQASELTSRAAALKSRAESTREQAERLAAQAATLSGRLTQAEAEWKAAETAHGEADQRRTSLFDEKRAQNQQIQSSEQELRQLERTREEGHRKVTQLRSRLQSLEELEAAHEGFGDGSRAALEWAQAGGHSSRFFAAADGLKIEAGFELAVEGWLENRLETLATDDPQLALEALRSLQKQGGRAAIQLLGQDFGAAGPKAELSAITQALASRGVTVQGTLASKVMTTGGRRFGALLDAVLLVDAWDSLLVGAPCDLQGWSLVDAQGAVCEASGLLRGGQGGNSAVAGMLKRKQQIEALREEVAAAESAQAGAEDAAASAKQTLELARARLQSLVADLQEAEVRVAGLDRDRKQGERAARELGQQAESLGRELESLRATAETSERERLEAEAQVAGILGSREESEAEISEGEAQVQGLEDELRQAEQELQTRRIGEASLRERAQSLARELAGMRSVLEDRKRRRAEVAKALERAKRERDQFHGGDSGFEEKIETLMRQLAEKREELSLLRDRMERSSSQASESIERIKRLHKEGDAKTAESNQLALEMERQQGELTHLMQNLEEKYGPGCLEQATAAAPLPVQDEMTEPVVTAEMSAEEELLLGEEVERLRERIRRLGEVNVLAIEEFEEAKKRHDYLQTEKADLELSIQNLQDAIEHINKTSEERFKKAFEAIATRFERLFPIIFGGGSAKLSLVYPEGSQDILEAGVDILAQPPGKKVSNIGLLSGGEKALTAVSLIFAIFMVKPSPFCLLDEVDAPLDDANIGKFNALLKEMSAKSQFILITHNKKTMELNDTLYGVTMEEPGVSKMVSIRLQ